MDYHEYPDEKPAKSAEKYMKMDLETLLRAIHKTNGINHISLTVRSDDKSFAVVFRGGRGFAPYRSVHASCPVHALKLALSSINVVQDVIDKDATPKPKRAKRDNSDLLGG